MFYQPSKAAWQVGAESPERTPVLYAVGDMAQTVRARGDVVTVALWGPQDGAWHRVDTPAAKPSAPEPSPERPAEPVKLAERMSDRRHQVLMAGLSKAGLYDLSPRTRRRCGRWSTGSTNRRSAGSPTGSPPRAGRGAARKHRFAGRPTGQ
ncbi:hypothetical protein O1M54_24950 [Streptomyces diastatochromogenes]|nr:hypothetical protein [Streptomyces diastatochromogenes]